MSSVGNVQRITFDLDEQVRALALAKPEKILNVLLIEDSLSDGILTRKSLDRMDTPFRLSLLRKGEDVLPWLLSPDNPKPDLILLDLGLPGMTGFEVLEKLMWESTRLRAIPIVILTGHDEFKYVCNTHKLCIMDYIGKPCSDAKMRRIVDMVRAF